MYIHIDLDCYFVSCERIKHPTLKKEPVVVINGSDSAIFSNKKIKEEKIVQREGAFTPNAIYKKYSTSLKSHNNLIKHSSLQYGCQCSFCKEIERNFYDSANGFYLGTVVAKSYEAKAYGIKTGTKLQEAIKLCRNLIAIPQDYYDYYIRSNELKKYLHTQIPSIEQYSIDEFFGDLDGWVADTEVESFLKELQESIKQKFSLPVSIGASSGKWIAKLATNFAKPYGIKVVAKEEIQTFIKDIDIEEFPGIGRAYTKRLKSRGIYKLGEIQRVYPLFESWGKYGRDLYHRVHGDGDRSKICVNRVK